jgi:NAD(P)-dependent dehydrogenase (short-subunit alcohol dehydrogenase family)
MARTALVTGSASGIGKATAATLADRGYTVIGADLHDADITADLSTGEGRAALVEEATRLSGGTIDAVLAIAGLAEPIARTVAVNYFGMVSTLTGLRPLLAASDAPRAAGVASMASIMPVDDALVQAMADWDEPAALARASELEGSEETQNLIYAASKKAFAQWIRRTAPTADWAGAGIALNAVAPGVIATPMTADLTATEEARAELLTMVPMPLNGIAEPEVVANLLAWLVSEENSHLCGQVVFVDGGSDAVMRGDAVW